MISLAQLMDLVCTSDAEIIEGIVERILHRDDVGDFKVGWGSLWVPRRKSLRGEAALELGWGCGYLGLMEDAVDEIEDSEWSSANADQIRDFREQKIMMARLIHAYLFICHEDGYRPSWLVRDGAWGRELEFKIGDGGEEVEIWVVRRGGGRVRFDVGERIVLP